MLLQTCTRSRACLNASADMPDFFLTPLSTGGETKAVELASNLYTENLHLSPDWAMRTDSALAPEGQLHARPRDGLCPCSLSPASEEGVRKIPGSNLVIKVGHSWWWLG